jgi:hypothetical protein
MSREIMSREIMSTPQMMVTSKTVDLTHYDREQIHLSLMFRKVK